MPSLVTVTQPANNEILVSSSYLQGLGSYGRIGASQIEHTTETNELTGDIFFKFYTCNDSTGSKVYSALDVSSAISNATIENRFLTFIFSQFYNDPTFVADIGGAMIDISERLSGSGTLTNNLAANLTMPSAADNPNYLEFVSMGVGSFVGATYINGDNSIPNTLGSLRGTRVGQIHMTSVDPLASPTQESLYDNSDSGCWQFSDYGVEGIIVYTNLFGGAFDQAGLDIWSQLLCVYPILADIYNADYACMFNTSDTSFLRSGLGYFNRSVRASTNPNFYGWSGNFLLSIWNDWGIPVVCPIWGISDLSIAAFFNNPPARSVQFNTAAIDYGDITDPSKYYRFIGPQASNNVSNTTEKNSRSLLPLLWANECAQGTQTIVPNITAVPPFEASVTALGFASGADYVAATQATLQGLTEGYNAHIYKCIEQNTTNNGGFTPTSTRSYLAGISWSGKLASQPSLSNVFVDRTGFPTYYSPAYHFYNTNNYMFDLFSRLTNCLSPTTNANYTFLSMSSTAELLFEAWLYTP